MSAATYAGRACKRCGNCLRYESNSCCVHCQRRRVRNPRRTDANPPDVIACQPCDLTASRARAIIADPLLLSEVLRLLVWLDIDALLAERERRLEQYRTAPAGEWGQ